VTHIGKLLGVQITDTFNWKAHCDVVVSKLRSTAYRFSMLRATLTLPSLKKVYFADVQSQILYTIVIWGGSPHMQPIFTAQKRCVSSVPEKCAFLLKMHCTCMFAVLCGYMQVLCA
jgi:hypothetical protein